jgi:hypothetical protein
MESDRWQQRPLDQGNGGLPTGAGCCITLSLLDTLKDPPRWSFGGGTSLAIFYDHRISYDIDVFVSNSDTLAELSPAHNAATKDLLAGRSYQFPGNYLKLQLESGEVDFIVAGRRTSDPVQD